MRRDWDCIRDILIALERKETSQEFVSPEALKVWDDQTLAYNVILLQEAGLIDAITKILPGGLMLATPRSMTWEGHELLDRLRSQTHWTEIRKLARERGLELSFEVVKLLATHVIEKMLGRR